MNIKSEWKEYYGRVRQAIRIGMWAPGDARFDEAWERSQGDDPLLKPRRRVKIDPLSRWLMRGIFR